MIELINYEKFYSKKQLYDPTSVTFPSKSISFLMGKNGSGKTTLLKCIAGLEDYKGDILFNGQPLFKVREKCLVIWDDAPSFLNLNGTQNLKIFTESRCTISEINKAAEKYLGLDIMKHKVKTYSYGQKKKLMLALADLLKPEYLIMDEISNGLDIDMMDELSTHLKELKKNCTILLTGHQFSFYEKVAENIFIKKNKNIKYISPEQRNSRSLEDLYHDPSI